jgi:hypothetical protein
MTATHATNAGARSLPGGRGFLPGGPAQAALDLLTRERARPADADPARSARMAADAGRSVAPEAAGPRRCAGPGCGRSLEGRPRATYCSDLCRKRAYLRRTADLAPSSASFRARAAASSSTDPAAAGPRYIADPAPGEPDESWWCRRFRLLVECGQVDEASSLWSRVRAQRPDVSPSAAARHVAGTLGLD